LELFDGTLEGTVAGKPFRGRDKGVLKFSMVDVQQGDGMILETPPDENHATRLVFIDGGDNKLFARHVAARYRHRQSSTTHPLEVDLILITHGDADHFEGLIDIKRSETERGISDRKRLFIHPRRVYHIGKVSRGETGIVLCTELAAFFAKRDHSHERLQIAKFYEGDEVITRADLRRFYSAEPRSRKDEEALPSFFGFERTNFGIIHIRTDGERVLVFTHSGKEGMREAYRFTVDANHTIRFARDVMTG
jgi:ribonuclease BN (tRNA processing enzyme)